MKLTVVRINDNGNNSLGKLFVDGKFQCYTLEDTYRAKKIMHVTRITSGTYPITLRTEGGFHQRYLKHKNEAVRNMHKGVFWVREVPGFEFILIHIGNYAKDTSGCLLVGEDYAFNSMRERMITKSTDAYIELYQLMLAALENNETISISYLDADRE